MEIQVRNDDGVEFFELTGRITILAGADLLRSRFERSLEEGHRHFVFDLRELLFMDSASIGEMLICLKHANEQSGSVRLLLLEGGSIDEVIRTCGLKQVFDVSYQA